MREDDVQTLVELGLTSKQARVFLVLAKVKSSTARSLATASGQARQDIYKVLDELSYLGLIEKQLDAPTRFTIIPIHEAFSNLLSNRIKEASELRKKTKILIRSLQEFDAESAQEENKLLLIPGGETAVLRIRKSVETSQQSIDAVGPQKYMSQGFFFLTDALEKALERGVKIRFVTYFDEKSPRFLVPNTLAKNRYFKTRTIQNYRNSRFFVCDKKEVTVVLAPNGDFAKPSLLWSNCISLVDDYQDYFETLWQDGINKARIREKGATESHALAPV